MYEFHGWFSLEESTLEPNEGEIANALVDMRPLLEQFEPHRSSAEVRPLNGEYFLTVNGLLNREIDEARTLDDLLAFLAARLPGSWGSSMTGTTNGPKASSSAGSASAYLPEEPSQRTTTRSCRPGSH